MFTESERRIAELLEAEGHTVQAIEATGVGRSADALVDGEPVEFKTPQLGADSRTIKNAVGEALAGEGQARRIIVDARSSGLTRPEAERALARVGGVARGKLDSLRIIGEGYDIAREYS